MDNGVPPAPVRPEQAPEAGSHEAQWRKAQGLAAGAGALQSDLGFLFGADLLFHGHDKENRP
jgi:hypothetical protein